MLTISASEFYSNTASGGSGMFGGGGGAMAFGGITLIGTNTQNVSLSGVTIRENGAEAGGAIASFSLGYFGAMDTNIAIENSTITENEAEFGGAIAHITFQYLSGNSTSDMIIRGTDILSNTAIDDGGAVVNVAGGEDAGSDPSANLTIEHSNIISNTAESAGGIFNGAVTNDSGAQATAHTTISGSTLAQNLATDGYGGAVVNGGYSGMGGGGGIPTSEMLITNSTLSGNWAEEHGGAICNYDTTGITRLWVEHSTITDNVADYSGFGGATDDNGDGGGIYNTTGAQATLDHTIVAGNTDATSSGDVEPDISGVVAGDSYNLVGNTNGADGTIGDDSDIVNPTPGLDALADNGGPTWTHALLSGSAARDAGDPDFAGPPYGDQRGFQRIGNDRVDIGAYEYNPLDIMVWYESAEIANNDTVDFGSTSPDTPITRTITISNTGEDTLTLGTPSLPDELSIEGSFPTSLGPNGSADVVLRFTPDANGTYTGTVSFDTNDPDENPFTFDVTVDVQSPDIAILSNSVVLSTTSTVDFGITSAGEPITRTLTISNTGGVTLTVDSATLPAGFSLGSTLPMSIAANSAMMLDVRLDAETNGIYAGEMTVSSNDPDEATYSFNVTGQVGDTIGDLAASTISSTTIQLDWTDLSDAETEFQIERSLDGVTDWTGPMTVTMNTTSYQDTGLNPATTYYYRMRGANTTAGTQSDYTQVVSATTAPDLRVSMTCELVGRTALCTVNYQNGAPVMLAEYVGTAENVLLTMSTPQGATYNEQASSVAWTQVDATTSYTTSVGTLEPGQSGTATFAANLDSTVPISSEVQFQVNISGNTAGVDNATGTSQSSVELTAPGFDVFLPLIQRNGAATTGQVELETEQMSRWQRVAAWFSRVTRTIV